MTMPRYIDADAYEYPGDLINVPTADVVKVVRCKDCCHYKQNPWNKEDELLCQYWGDWLPTEPDDFCSCGAKMDGDKL